MHKPIPHTPALLAAALAMATPACALSEAAEVSFALDQAPCAHLSLPQADFDALSAQLRFEGGPEDQFAGALDHTLASCTEPSPDPFTWFEADLQADDTEQLTLNNNLRDLTRVRACTTLSVFADAGYPAPLCNVAGVAVNGVSLGAYAHVEPLKKRFLRRAFGDDTGSLYEATLADFTAEYLTDGLGRWEAKTSDTITDASLLLGVSQALEAPDEELEAALDEVIDLDAFLTFWALETLVGHQDGYTANGNNSYVYFDPTRGGRAVFIPWGTDDSMSTSGLAFTRGEIARRLSRHPTLYARYLDTLGALLDEVWDEDRLLARIDALSALAGAVEPLDEDNEAATEDLRGFVAGRRAEIEDFSASGGLPGDAEPAACDDLGPLDQLVVIGELTTTYGHSCASAPGRAPWAAWLAALALLGARSRRGRARP